MGEEGFNLLKKMATYDKRWVYLVLFILVLAPLVRPIGMPIAVSELTRNYYNQIMKLKEGDIVLDSWDMEYSGYMELKPGVLASHKLFIQKGVKLAITLNHPEGIAIVPVVLEELKPIMEEYDYKEGEDYIILGYVFPNEASVVAAASDFHAAIKYDWKGRSIEGTFLDRIHDGGDFALISDYTTGVMSGAIIRHFVLRFGVPMIQNCIGVSVPGALANLDARLLTAVLASSRGGAELEYLIKQPGPGLMMMDAFTLGHYMLIIFIVIGNIGYFGWARKAKVRERTAV